MINAKDYTSIKVKLINCDGNKLANDVYKFGRLSHDYNMMRLILTALNLSIK